MGRNLQKFMPDYDSYIYKKIIQKDINKMDSLKQEGRPNREISQGMEFSEFTIGDYL